MSKHDLILRTNPFIDVSARNEETVIFITISAWCKSLWIFQCNGFRKSLQIIQGDWIIESSFSKVSILFSHITQSVLLILLQGCFRKAGIQFKWYNVLCNEDGEYKTLKVFHPTPEHTVSYLQGRYEKWHMKNETKSISVGVTQVLVNSLFYRLTFIKSEFLRI